VVQPILVRPQGETYQLIAGERRWRAAKLAGLDSIPAIVKAIDDKEALEIALIENLLREDLNPLDVAMAYKALQDEFKLSHEEIGQKLGVDRSTVTNTLRLLRLPPQVQAMIRDGRLSGGHARSLLALESPDEQLRLAELFAQRQVSVRQAERMARAAAGRKASSQSKSTPRQDPNLLSAQNELERTLGTKVRIVGDEKRGRIEISYYSGSDLQRIYELITWKVA
jgi:ParB family chromosome partitioning protein